MAKKGSLSREEAGQLYEQMKRQMAEKMGGKVPNIGGEPMAKPDKKTKAQGKAIASEISKVLSGRGGKKPSAAELSKLSAAAKTASVPKTRRSAGSRAAIALVLIVACAKIGVSVIEHTGIVEIPEARASLRPDFSRSAMKMPMGAGDRYTKEEVKVLKALDSRRVQLEERAERLDSKEQELDARDRAFAAKITELKELTERLNIEREKDQRKKSNKLEQLANVYGSMNPAEAAALMEQLDVTIALSLIQRMPEKRIGQILSMMSPERALVLTRMLSESSK